eukprot:IDg18508t1
MSGSTPSGTNRVATEIKLGVDDAEEAPVDAAEAACVHHKNKKARKSLFLLGIVYESPYSRKSRMPMKSAILHRLQDLPTDVFFASAPLNEVNPGH